MRQKVYETKCDKRKDQLAGFWTFTLVNVPILVYVALNGLLWSNSFHQSSTPDWIKDVMTVLPWLINLLIIFIGLLLRPEFAAGFLVGLAIWAVASLLYVPSCMATCLLLQANYESESFVYFFTTMYLLIWLGLAAQRSYKLYNRDCAPKIE